MIHDNETVAYLLRLTDLGSSVAEADNLLERARVETSAFADLVNDRVDLVPGTKGSGKSALFRIFVDVLPDRLLRQRKVVVAHGIQNPGDPVFHAFLDQFRQLSEEDFVSFWCIYFVSLAHEQFIKGDRYGEFLRDAGSEVRDFRYACERAGIPEIAAKRSLRGILEWVLQALPRWRPRFRYRPSDGSGEWELDLFGAHTPTTPTPVASDAEESLPRYMNQVKEALDAILGKVQLSLWLMVDRLDEVFPRRSVEERRALRGLLRATRYFASDRIRVKVFLRDDMLDQLMRTEDGFTALTHVTVRQADALRWTEEQLLTMLVKRLFANEPLAVHLGVDRERLDASATYRTACFNQVFPPTVHRGPKQSPTLRWMYRRCADGRDVVTPRDILDLVIRAKQRQEDICAGDPDGKTEWIIGAAAVQYGFERLSERKRQTYLEAEFPHLWRHIEKFIGGKADYDTASLRAALGKDWKPVIDDLVAIGFLSKGAKGGQEVYSIPFLYRHGLQVTQGRASGTG